MSGSSSIRTCNFLFALLFLFILSPLNELHSQNIPKATIKGRVLDDSTRAPLPLANVFVANSTIGCAADGDGRFELKGIPLGTQQIVASIVGYAPRTIIVLITDSTERKVEFRLRARAVQLPPVVIEWKDPVLWKKHLERFILAFFGSSANASECTLLNPEVLDFMIDEKSEGLSAIAREPLHIINKALGYRCEYYLDFFKEIRVSRRYISIRYIGPARFELLRTQNEDEMNVWKFNRQKAYQGSKRHFLTTLVEKSTKDEGFEVNRIRKNWIEYALHQRTGFTVHADTLAAPGDMPFQKRLRFEDALQVVYTSGRQRRFSVIELDRRPVTIYADGFLEDPLNMLTYGYWAYERFADMLPIDYEPD